MTIAQWQIEMAARSVPAVAGIVEHSTPVLSFGDPLLAEVATLGINPSRLEFYSDGILLADCERRLATTESLGATAGRPLTADQARQVVADCNSYFGRNPYRWFKPLDALLDQAVGASYYNGTACHLDLVQWATDPVWGELRDPAGAKRLLSEGSPWLKCTLSRSNVRLVLLNGTAVIRQVHRTGLADLHEVESKKFSVGSITCRLFVGEGQGINYVGWSTNLQASHGVSNDFKQRLAQEVRDLVAAPVAPLAPVEVAVTASGLETGGDGFLPRGIKVSGKRELAELLLHWYQSSHAETIGDAAYGGTAWVTVGLRGHDAVLNADTKRAAVASYLEHVRLLGPELPWRVIATGRGSTVKKVVFSDDPAGAAGWYLYLSKPLSQPGLL